MHWVNNLAKSVVELSKLLLEPVSKTSTIISFKVRSKELIWTGEIIVIYNVNKQLNYANCTSSLPSAVICRNALSKQINFGQWTFWPRSYTSREFYVIFQYRFRFLVKIVIDSVDWLFFTSFGFIAFSWNQITFYVFYQLSTAFIRQALIQEIVLSLINVAY